MINRLLAVFLAVALSVVAYQSYSLSTQATLLADTQSALERRTEALEQTSKTLALKSELADIKENVSILLAQNTLVINEVAQVNIGTLSEVKKEIQNETKVTGNNGDELHPKLEQWLRKYEANRVHSN